MARKLWLASVLGLALLAGSSAIAPALVRAQESSAVATDALAQARAQYDAAEASYAHAGEADGSGLSGQLQQLASAGSTGEANQLLAAREAARTGLESAISSYLSALKTQYDAALKAGKSDDAEAILTTVQQLGARVQQLATDAANEKLAAKGFGPMSGTAGSSAGFGASAPLMPATAAPTATAQPSSSGPSYGDDPSATKTAPTNAATNAAATGTAAAPKPRKATGRLVLVARGERPETTLARLDATCALLRAGKALPDEELELPAGEVEVYLVEHWRERTPSRIKLTKDDAHLSDLARLRLSPGATCSISGIPRVVTPGSRTEGEVVELQDWKLLALSSVERLGNVPSTVSAAARPLASVEPAKPAPARPAPAVEEEENFND